MKRAKRIYWINEKGKILEEKGKTHTEYIWEHYGKTKPDERDFFIENRNWIRVRLEESLCAIQAKTLSKEVIKRVMNTLPNKKYKFDLEVGGNFYKNIPFEIMKSGGLSIYPYKFNFQKV